MEHQTITLDGRDYVIVPRAEYDRLARRTVAGIELPPLPEADAQGNRPAVAFARATIARTIIGRMNAVGITQAQLGRDADVPAATLNRILKATRTPDESTVDKIEKALAKHEKSAIK